MQAVNLVNKVVSKQPAKIVATAEGPKGKILEGFRIGRGRKTYCWQSYWQRFSIGNKQANLEALRADPQEKERISP